MSEWDTLGEDVADLATSPGAKCKVGLMLAALPSGDREKVKAVVENRNYSATAVEKALRARLGDAAPSRHSIGSHRRGYCRCGR